MRAIGTVQDVLSRKNVLNRISYVPGGVSLELASLSVGKIVEEATPLSAPVNGIRKVCKQATILTGSTGTAIKVESSTNNFKVGNFIGLAEGGAAYAITGITTSSGVDTIAVGTTIGTPTVGNAIYEMAEESAAASALKNNADIILKEAFIVPSVSMVIHPADGLVRADVRKGSVGSIYLTQMKTIAEIAY